MQEFTYCIPTKVIFGKRTEDEVGQAVVDAGGTVVLVLYGGGSAVRNGLMDRVRASLEKSGLTYFVKGGVQANPVLSFVNDTLEEYGDKGIDFVVGVGGGSVLDTAKAVALGLAQPGVSVWSYFTGKDRASQTLSVGAIITIAAAGSETSDSTVLTNDATHEKRGYNDELNRPAFAIMNPELTYTLPPYQTACGTADILMHTLDRYFTSASGNELTDALAEAILRTTMTYGISALEKADDYEARSELMWCGSLSHNGLTGLGAVKDFTVHQLGHELSGRYGIAHGASLAIMWPAWARIVRETDPSRFARLGRTVFGVAKSDDEAASLACIGAVEDYFRALKLPVSLGESEIGVITEEEVEALTLGCSRNKSRSVGSFCPLDHDGLRQCYQAANQ